MKAPLKLECIGDSAFHHNKIWSGSLLDPRPRFPWCAELVAYECGEFELKMLQGQKDYSMANSKGSRGVYLYFWLEWGKVYQVHELTSWKKSKDWYAGVTENGDVCEITKEACVLCLS